MRPSRDQTPTGPGTSGPLFSHAIEFVLTRSVRDCAAQYIAQLSAVTGCNIDNDNFEAVTLTCAEFGTKTTAPQVLNALDYVNRISRQTAAAFENFDVILSSTMSAPPAVHGYLDQDDDQISAIDWTRYSKEAGSCRSGLLDGVVR